VEYASLYHFVDSTGQTKARKHERERKGEKAGVWRQAPVFFAFWEGDDGGKKETGVAFYQPLWLVREK
jgi:hypothetical protein